MIIEFDLRPEYVKNPPPIKIDKMFIVICLLFITFVALVSYSSFILTKDILFFKDGIYSLMTKVSNSENIRNKLRAEIIILKKQEAVYLSNLNIMNSDLPTLEILGVVDKVLPSGVTFGSLNINANNVSISGTASTEEGLVTATHALVDSGVFSKAQTPASNRIGNRSEGIKFTLSLTPLPLSEVELP